MDALTFKSKLKSIESFLKGKKVEMSITNENGTQNIVFDTVKAFGLKVLELEKVGAGFSISKFGNSMTQVNVLKDSEFNKWLSKGVWRTIYVNASTLDINA